MNGRNQGEREIPMRTDFSKRVLVSFESSLNWRIKIMFRSSADLGIMRMSFVNWTEFQNSRLGEQTWNN